MCGYIKLNNVIGTLFTIEYLVMIVLTFNGSSNHQESWQCWKMKFLFNGVGIKNSDIFLWDDLLFLNAFHEHIFEFYHIGNKKR